MGYKKKITDIYTLIYSLFAYIEIRDATEIARDMGSEGNLIFLCILLGPF